MKGKLQAILVTVEDKMLWRRAFHSPFCVRLGEGELCESGSLDVVPPHLFTYPLFCSSKLNEAALRENRLIC